MTEQPIFTQAFAAFVCEGDSISAEHEGFTLTARIYRDDCGDRPDERDCAFWPSLDPKDAGYIGDGKNQTQLLIERAKAASILAAWEADEWFYCGVAVTVERAGVALTEEYANALWGVECNYPDSDNGYLREVANELAGEALADARAKLAALCTCKDEEGAQ